MMGTHAAQHAHYLGCSVERGERVVWLPRCTHVVADEEQH
jgi:hypothetical protein